jgi:hypothetical protein
MRSPLPSLLLCAGSGALFCAPAASAQSGYFAPRGPEFIVNLGVNYDQTWARVSTDPTGSRWAFSFNGGQDVYARVFDLDAKPLSPNLSVNPTLTQYIQDEAEVSLDPVSGNFIVAFSERHGYDGEIMGIFARIFDANHVPLGNEIQINVVWQASQWRPLIDQLPGGGWVIAWSGTWAGDSIFRLVTPTGQFLTGDVLINTYTSGGQTLPDVAVAPDGRMFFVYVDYSAHGGVGTGTNLWGRLFDANANPLGPDYPLNTPSYAVGHQKQPRAAADGLGNYIVTWEDQTHDGSGTGIHARRFDHDGMPIGPEFAVNTTTAANQLNPHLAADAFGGFVIAWEDHSSGSGDIRARRFDPQGNGIGPDFLVNTTTAGNQRNPDVEMTWTGEDVLVCWDGPGVSVDVYAQFFSTYQPPAVYCTPKTNSQGCAPLLGFTGKPTLTGADDFHVIATQVLNNKFGLLFHGRSSASTPFAGGTLCIQPPLARTPLQHSGGNPPPNDCSGGYDFHASQAWMASHALSAGDTVYAQYWQRDPGFAPPNNVGLSAGAVFEIRP